MLIYVHVVNMTVTDLVACVEVDTNISSRNFNYILAVFFFGMSLIAVFMLVAN